MIYKEVITVSLKSKDAAIQFHQYYDTDKGYDVKQARAELKKAKRNDLKKGYKSYYNVRPYKKEGLCMIIKITTL